MSSDYGDMCRELREERKELRAKYGKPCPDCQRLLPKAHPTILLPQQRCKIHNYRDPRPRITPETMTPDKLPSTLRVKLLPWIDYESHSLAVTAGPQLWYAFDTHATVPNPDGGFNLQIHATSREDAKDKAQQYLAQQICDKLEIVE